MRSFLQPIRIAFDGNEANVQNRVGSNVYAAQILRQLEVITRTSRKSYQITVLLSSEPVLDMPAPRPGFEYRIVRPVLFWTQLALPLFLFVHKNDFDVFFTPGHYAPRFSSVPYVSSVMDLAFLEFPEQFRGRDLWQLKNWTKYSVKKARAVVTISKFSKAEIIKYYGLSSNRILVAPPGINYNLKQKVSATTVTKNLKEMEVSKPFFLYLGTLQPRKNLLRLVEAFELYSYLADENQLPRVQLVLAGKLGWLTEGLHTRVNNSPFAERIVLPGFVTDEQKRVLLRTCLASFNLGLYEGFGIPALEALSLGALPVVANNTSLPEVVGSSGLQIDPYNVETIASAFWQVATNNQALKDNLLVTRDKQLAKFNYEKSANQILSLLARVGSKKIL